MHICNTHTNMLELPEESTYQQGTELAIPVTVTVLGWNIA